MGLLPPQGFETFVLLPIRNFSGILGPTALVLLLLPYLGPERRALRTRLVRRSAHPLRCGRPRLVALLAVGGLAHGPRLRRPVARPSPSAGPGRGVGRVPAAADRRAWPSRLAARHGRGPGDAGAAAVRSRSPADPFESAAIAQAFLITLVLATFLISFDVEERRTATERARSAERVAESRATLFSTVIDNLDEGVTRHRRRRRLHRPQPGGSPAHGDRRVPRPDAEDPAAAAHGRRERPADRRVADMPHTRARAESRASGKRFTCGCPPAVSGTSRCRRSRSPGWATIRGRWWSTRCATSPRTTRIATSWSPLPVWWPTTSRTR